MAKAEEWVLRGRVFALYGTVIFHMTNKAPNLTMNL